MGVVTLDWFEPALQGSGSWAAGLDRLIALEETKLQFVRCLKSALCHPVPHAPDRIALLHQDVKILDQTLQLRLGVLAMDRPQAWFRHSPATERGPFAATVFEEPIFARFDESRASTIRHLLPELWRLQQVNSSGYDPSASLWGRLLQLNKKYAELRQLPHPFHDVCIDEFPDALPDDVSSPALVQFSTLLSQRMRSCQRDLENCFQRLWSRSESFLYALHIQHMSSKARQQGQSGGRSQRLSQALSDALHFMNFGAIPSTEDLKQRYRAMAQTLHPDKGGNEERFSLLTQHYQQILQALRRSH